MNIQIETTFCAKPFTFEVDVRTGLTSLPDSVVESFHEDLLPALRAKVSKTLTARQEDEAVLKRAFELVEDPNDWRAPISCRLATQDLVAAEVTMFEVLAAIRFYTATEGRIDNAGDNWVEINADGYRMGPAGP